MPMDLGAIKVYVSQEQGFWVANAIDFDIAAQSETLDGLIENMIYAIETEIVILKENKLEFSHQCGPAPDQYLNAYKNSQFRGFYAAVIDGRPQVIECRLADNVIKVHHHKAT